MNVIVSKLFAPKSQKPSSPTCCYLKKQPPMTKSNILLLGIGNSGKSSFITQVNFFP